MERTKIHKRSKHILEFGPSGVLPSDAIDYAANDPMQSSAELAILVSPIARVMSTDICFGIPHSQNITFSFNSAMVAGEGSY